MYIIGNVLMSLVAFCSIFIGKIKLNTYGYFGHQLGDVCLPSGGKSSNIYLI